MGMDPFRPNEPIELRATASNGREATLLASTFREDLLDAGKGDRRHGFVFPSSQLNLARGMWRVGIAIAETGASLRGSPATVACEGLDRVERDSK